MSYACAHRLPPVVSAVGLYSIFVAVCWWSMNSSCSAKHNVQDQQQQQIWSLQQLTLYVSNLCVQVLLPPPVLSPPPGQPQQLSSSQTHYAGPAAAAADMAPATTAAAAGHMAAAAPAAVTVASTEENWATFD